MARADGNTLWSGSWHNRLRRNDSCAPGNAGTAIDGVNVPIEPSDFDKLIRFAKKENVGLTVVGPEDALTLGIVDAFQVAGLRIFGPTKAAARLEGSKVFAKQLMRHADVPTAEFRIFDHPDPARTYVESREYPVVVKADGLAAGKGVIVCKDSSDALKAIDASWSVTNSANRPGGAS